MALVRNSRAASSKPRTLVAKQLHGHLHMFALRPVQGSSTGYNHVKRTHTNTRAHLLVNISGGSCRSLCNPGRTPTRHPRSPHTLWRTRHNCSEGRSRGRMGTPVGTPLPEIWDEFEVPSVHLSS